MRRSIAAAVVLICLLIALPTLAYAEENDPGAADAADNTDPEDHQDPDDERESRMRLPDRLGLIFNTSSILLELDEYQNAGIGLKVRWERIALRGLLGFGYESGNETFDLSFGTALEYHLAPGAQVSPYVGGRLALEYERDYNVDVTEFKFGLGPLFGVEVSPLDSLSVFAEYQLQYSATYVSTADDSTWNYKFATGLGNRAALGIIVYFLDRRPPAGDRLPAEDNDEEPAAAE